MDQSHPNAMTTTRARKTVYVVLPAYNEAQRIGILLEHISEALDDASLPYQILVVDDGSSDDTAKIVTEASTRMPVILEQHAKNMGLGATIRDGILSAANRASDKDIIITMDADDTHSPGLILRMVRMVREGCDVVIASRYQPGSRTIGVPFMRVLISYLGSILFRVLLPIKGVKDFTCGYRAYRAEVIKSAEQKYGGKLFDQEGFQCMVDILLKLRKMDLIFAEVPMILRYDIKEGGSKMRVGATMTRTLGLIIRRRFER